MIEFEELNEKIKELNVQSMRVYGNCGHIAGTYEVLMSNLILGWSTPDAVVKRLDDIIEELKQQ